MTTWPINAADAASAEPPSEPTPISSSADADHEALAAALADGSIPTFAELPDTTSVSPLQAVDLAAEREAYAALIAMINQHKDPGTEAIYLEPDAYMNGLS